MKKNILMLVLLVLSVVTLTSCGKKPDMDISTVEKLATDTQWQTEDAIDIASEDLCVWYDSIVEIMESAFERDGEATIKIGNKINGTSILFPKKMKHKFHDNIVQDVYNDLINEVESRILDSIKDYGIGNYLKNENEIMDEISDDIESRLDTIIHNSYELKMKELIDTYNIIYTEEE